MRIGVFFRKRLESSWLPLHLAVLSTLLCLPGIRMGYQADDHLHRAVLSGEQGFTELGRGPWSLFTFMDGDAAKNVHSIAQGRLPWWTTPTIRAALFRPLTGWTHWVDMRLWPNDPTPAHVHSLVWHALVIALATLLLQWVMPVPWIGGFAALLYAVDDARGIPAMWIANRNALTTMAFVLLTLVCHYQWRMRGRQAAAWLGPVCFGLGLCASEGGVTAAGYLLAFAIFLELGSWRQRTVSLLAYVLVGMAWLVIYRMLGYGVWGLGAYVDPAGDPLRFLATLPLRAPLILCGMLAFPPSEAGGVLAKDVIPLLFGWTWLVVVAIAVLMWPVVKREPVARFLALGSALAVLPVCATFPADRLLTFAGWGAGGMVAWLMVDLVRRNREEAPGGMRRWGRRGALAALVLVHQVIGPLNLLQASKGIEAFGVAMETSARSLPVPASPEERLVVAATPSAFISVQAQMIRATYRLPWHEYAVVLSSTTHSTEITRVDERTLLVRPDGGYLLPQGTVPPGKEAERPLVDLHYIFAVFDGLFRAVGQPFEVGESHDLKGVRVTIRSLTADGRPAEVAVTFEKSADDPTLRWVTWDDGVYVPMTPPRVGETLTLPPNRVPFELW